MKQEMTIKALKIKLASLEKADLEQMLIDLYKNCESASQHMNAKLLGDSYQVKLLGLYRDRLFDVFFPENARKGFSLTRAKQLIDDFKQVCPDEQRLVDLKLSFVEYGTEFAQTFGDMNGQFYNTLERMFRDATAWVSQDKRFFDAWNSRMLKIMKDSEDIGWGYHDWIEEEYYQIPWALDNLEEERD